MHSTSHRFPRPASFVATLVASCWLTIQFARAQTLEASFGVIRSYDLSGEFERLTPVTFSEQKLHLALLWTPRKPSAALVSFDSAGIPSTRPVSFSFPFDDLRVLSLHGTNQPGFLLLDRAKRQITLAQLSQNDSLRAAGTFTLPFEPDGMAVGDLNNDRRDDLLIYARNTPGVLPYLNRGKGQFAQAPIIAPDNPVAALSLIHLNDDNVLDIVLYDWVKSEIHLLYGVGRGRFFDQTTIPVAGEVKELIAVDINHDMLSDLVLWFSKPSLVQWREANGLGDFLPRGTIHVAEALRIVLADITNNGWSDFTVLTAKPSLQSFIYTGEDSFDQNELAIGRARDIIIADINNDQLNDAIVSLPKQKRLAVLFNAQTGVSVGDSLDYATGLQPVSCSIADVNRDGKNDILVLNAESNSLSIFFGRDAGIAGQVTYAVPPRPTSMSVSAMRDSTLQIILSHGIDRSLSVFTLDFRDNSSVSATIPDVGVREVVSDPRREPGPLQFYCLSLPERGIGPSLLLFQQIGARTFVEQSFRLTVPDSLLGATVSDINGDGFADVVYVFRNAETGRYEMAVSVGDSVSAFTPRVFQLEVKEEAAQKAFLWSADFNGDGKNDILLAFPEVAQTLKFSLGEGDGTFHEPQPIMSGVRLADRRQLRVTDVDGDGKIDIVVNNASTGSIGWMRGRGDGSFESFQHLVSSAGVSHFALGDVTGDGVMDLAVVLRDEGILRIYNGELLLAKRPKASN